MHARRRRASSPRGLVAVWVAIATIGLALSLDPGPSYADPAPLRADVLLARHGRIYVALADSGSVGVGDRLTLRSGKKTIATAEVTALHDGALAVASLTSGSLAKTKKVSSLRVLHEPRTITRPVSLRLGIPSGGRSNLLVPCASTSIRAPSDSGARIDGISTGTFRVVRDPAKSSNALWPDTLWIRLFGDPIDEEIALERGELDVAVFWPGELSAHFREAPRWRGSIRTSPSGAGLALLTTAAQDRAHPVHGGSRPFRRLQALDADLLRGDLGMHLPLRDRVDPIGSSTDSTFAGRFTVEPPIPGRSAIERLLNEPVPPGSRVDLVRYRIVFIDRVDDAALARDRLFPTGNGAVAWVLPLSYPTVARPDLEGYLDALGPAALTQLIQCNRGANAR